MNSASENISLVVALLTAILSKQDDLAYEIVLESNTEDLFSTMSGMLISAFTRLAEFNGTDIESYLKDLGMFAFEP